MTHDMPRPEKRRTASTHCIVNLAVVITTVKIN